MLSPLGRNAQQCCDSFGFSLHNIHAVCNKLVWSLFYRNLELPELDTIQTIKELLCVKYGDSSTGSAPELGFFSITGSAILTLSKGRLCVSSVRILAERHTSKVAVDV